jgi:hypothetical protein
MKSIFFIAQFLLFATYSFAQHEHHSAPAKADSTKPKPKSPRLEAMDMVGNNHVHIDYGSPSVRGRVIWNGLVAYKQVWATGAHKATWIDFSKDVMIEGKHIPKGRYGFFTIPDKEEWTLILNKTWDMHLSDDYKAENDIIRVKVKPKKSKKIVESLTYEVLPMKGNKGKIKMSWEFLSVSLDFINHE